MSEVIEGLNKVKDSIKEAAKEAGRDEKEITLVAVSKTKPVEMIEEAYRVGIRDFGENKVQELCDKMEQLPKDIRWHMIGHLQRNKVKYIIGKVTLIHSVDSYRLAEEISKQAVKNQCEQDILVEINMGRETTKFGLMEEDAVEEIRKMAALPGLHIKGLMTSAPYVVESDENMEIFHKMKRLAVDIQDKNIDNVRMDILSMGMSQDYEAAIKQGSTMVRVGSKIFGQRYYNEQA
ncbi:MAG: YggS family pyridoxal phosphate-dependent enzyme [Lachnospiraceae bacterium]|nr:YggS family pyridoxal phosphate-dependent enzyme [Lachnospiraceae bacterium]